MASHSAVAAESVCERTEELKPARFLLLLLLFWLSFAGCFALRMDCCPPLPPNGLRADRIFADFTRSLLSYPLPRLAIFRSMPLLVSR